MPAREFVLLCVAIRPLYRLSIVRDRVSFGVGVRVSKLLRSNLNPSRRPNLTLTVTIGQPGGTLTRRVRRNVYTFNPPSEFKSQIEQCYHLQDTCYERRPSGNRRKLNYAIFNIYSCFDVIFSKS